MNSRQKMALGLVLLACLILPWTAGEFYVNLVSQILIAALFASSLNLLVGYAGLTSLGHAAFLGFAAYVSAWLYLKMGWTHEEIAPVALGATLLLACVFGWISLRATGLGFLMLTLALSQVLWGVAYRWVSVTDGDNGLRGLTRPAPFGLDLEDPMIFYYFALVVCLIALFLMVRFVQSPFGAAVRGTRDHVGALLDRAATAEDLLEALRGA